jgi:aspartate/tyrosine/aromatic aminotransferase
MRARIAGLRAEFVQHLSTACPERDFSWIARQHGMFSLLGIDPAQVQEMRAKHHVYMMDDSRINIAGLRAGNLAYVARALAQVLRESV